MTDEKRHVDALLSITDVLREEKKHLNLRDRPVGLALSGGGIRSATFGLGVLQALARNKRLRAFDYLSTVSGGGYIGSWLTAWINRKSIETVERELGQVAGDGKGGREPPEVVWLRKYSNYLTPRPGWSMDSVTLAATWLRNVLLNLIIVVALLSALFTLPLVLLPVVESARQHPNGFGSAGLAFVTMCFAFVAYNLVKQGRTERRDNNWLTTTSGVVVTVLATALLAACCIAIAVGHGQHALRLDSAAVMTAAWLLALVLVWTVFVAAAFFLKGRPLFAVFGAGLLALTLVCGVAYVIRDVESVSTRGALAIGSAVAFLYFTSLYFTFGRGGLGVLKQGLVYALAVIAGVATAWVIVAGASYGLERMLADNVSAASVALLMLGPPAVLAAFGSATTVFTGITGAFYFERSREWWSRLNAWLLTATAAWLVWAGLAFLALPIVTWAWNSTWVASIAATGWIGSVLTTALLRQPEATSEKTTFRVDRILNVAASLFVVGLLIAVAAGTNATLLRWEQQVRLEHREHQPGPPTVPAAPAAAGIDRHDVSWDVVRTGDVIEARVTVPVHKEPTLASLAREHLAALSRLTTRWPLEPQAVPTTKSRSATTMWIPGVGDLAASEIALVGLIVITLVFGWRVNVNKFSLHNLYKNRLMRCYLGASHIEERDAQPFVGLDDDDDIALAALHGRRPFHVICAALNLTQGAELAWQERKAAAFSFSPLHCGFVLAGSQQNSTKTPTDGATAATGETPGFYSAFRDSQAYATNGPVSGNDQRPGSHDDEDRGITLGMALATSGAALSPNMGLASTAMRAFALTVFNLRLGRWCSNPARGLWRKSGPSFGLISLLQELIGNSNESTNYVHVSDGGHFENIGLYELVRRECKSILVVDAAADPERVFADFAESIRRCRVDFGIEVTINLRKLQASEVGFVRGEIRYANGSTADLIVIKPTVIPSAPADVLNYAKHNTAFPQQTTADQFFGESQFESYRRLGLLLGEQCLAAHGALFKRQLVAVRDRDEDTTGHSPAKRGSKRIPVAAALAALPTLWLALGAAVLLSGLIQLGDSIWVGSDSANVAAQNGVSSTSNKAAAADPGAGARGLKQADNEAPEPQYVKAAKRIQQHAPKSWQFARLLLDDALVVAYLVALVCTYLAALAPYSDRARDTVLREITFWSCVVFLTVPTALVDVLENAFLFAGEAPQDVAVLTTWKFTLFYLAASLALVLYVVGAAWRVPMHDAGANVSVVAKESEDDFRSKDATSANLAGAS